MKRVLLNQESFRFRAMEAKPGSADSIGLPTKGIVVDLGSIRKRVAESVQAGLVSEVCARATHMDDVLPRER